MSNEFKKVRERDLAKLLQAYFRRFVESARIVRDPETGEAAIIVEFRNGASAGEDTRRVA